MNFNSKTLILINLIETLVKYVAHKSLELDNLNLIIT